WILFIRPKYAGAIFFLDDLHNLTTPTVQDTAHYQGSVSKMSEKGLLDSGAASIRKSEASGEWKNRADCNARSIRALFAYLASALVALGVIRGSACC
ncbi:MAG TPA: hypothetical protein VG498_05900, partial [Terriglobales bacterium]|nr:hypothetical protein [Terriglobales bacterium]